MTLVEGLPKTNTVDPGDASKLNLVTTTAYEAAGPGRFRRPIARTLPAGDATDVSDRTTSTVYNYYGAYSPGPPVVVAEGSPANVCGLATGVNQGGRLKTTTGPSPDATTGGRRATTVVYDAAGRTVASRVGTEAWTCTAYDTRGRITSLSIPAFGTEPAHTFTYAYVSGPTPPGPSPLMATITEGSGVITTKIDLLGRVIAYTDIFGQSTASLYAQSGRLSSTSGPAGARATVYDPAGRVLTQSLDGTEEANACYDANGELAGVAYANATKLWGTGTACSNAAFAATPVDLSIPAGGDPRQRRAHHGAELPAGALGGTAASLASDLVNRSQSGKVVDESIDGTDACRGHARAGATSTSRPPRPSCTTTASPGLLRSPTATTAR